MVSFSNRCFPTKAVAAWLYASDDQHVELVRSYFESAGGFARVRENGGSSEGYGDPLYAVWARRDQRRPITLA